MEGHGGDVKRVVKEIPVYLNKNVEGLLHVLQFHQRPVTYATSDLDIQEVKYKSNARKLQVTHGLDVQAVTFDPETSALLAEAAAGIGLDEDLYAPDKQVEIDKATLEGNVSTLMTSQGRYVVGVIRDGSVTLLPMEGHLPMAPVFPYLNQADKAMAAYKKSKERGGESDEEEEEPSKVTVKFARTPGGGQQAKASSSSFAARKREEEEPWNELHYEDAQDGEWLGRSTDHTKSPFYTVPRLEYLKALFPRQQDNSAVASGPTPSVEDMKLLRSLPEQLKLLFLNAKVLPYSSVLEFVESKLKSSVDEASLMRALQTVASLIRPPIWVVRSDVLYPEAFKSPIHGIQGTILQRGRDTILSEFRSGGRLDRRKMVAVSSLPVEEVTEIFEGVAERVSGLEKGGRGNGWVLKYSYEDGEEWSRKWPEVLQRQTLIWEMKAERSRLRRRSSSSSSNEGDNRAPGKVGGRRRSRGKSESSSGGGESSGFGGDDSGGGNQRRRKKSGSKLPPGIPSKVES